MTVLSVDLAYRRYRDVGIAVLGQNQGRVTAHFPTVPLSGEPDADALAEFLASLATEEGASLILIDGPQAWKSPGNGLLDCRVCERQLNTPAKTGEVGQVKPAAYGPFVKFSIHVFDALASRGWPRLDRRERPTGNAVVESFPHSAWRFLRLKPLPSKAKTCQPMLEAHLAALLAQVPMSLNSQPNHDELQALIAGLGGLALERGDLDHLYLAGEPPYRVDGEYREGFVLNPVLGKVSPP